MNIDAELELTQFEGVYMLLCAPEACDALLEDVPFSAEVRLLRGERCSSKAATYQEWASAFQFPQYAIEANWDGFWECITDLDWGRFYQSDRIVAVQTMATCVMPELEDARRYFELLRDAPSEFRRERMRKQRNLDFPPRANARLEIILHAPIPLRSKLENLLAQMSKTSNT